MNIYYKKAFDILLKTSTKEELAKLALDYMDEYSIDLIIEDYEEKIK